MSFSSENFLWKPVSAVVRYDFSKQTMKTMQSNEDQPSVQEMATEICLKEFDRHCLQGSFTFEFAFVYDKEEGAPVRIAKYWADVSELKVFRFDSL